MKFKLRIPKPQIAEWARRYGDKMDDAVPLDVGVHARVRGYVTRDEFLAMAR